MLRLFSSRLAWRVAVCGVVLWTSGWHNSAQAQTVVLPGTGKLIDEVGDHFEDPAWSYSFNGTKSSSNLNKQDFQPLGISTNERWSEGGYRGHPDVIQRIATPPGGLKDSTGALLLRSMHTGVHNRPSYEMQQDDLLVNISTKLNGYIPVDWNPNFVVRVYLPPWEQWEDRTGPTFGLRADCVGRPMSPQQTVRFRRVSKPETEQYWPGFFIWHNAPQGNPATPHSAYFIIRAGNQGEDLSGPEIKQLGWWTLGMSVTGDGKVHYFAKPGIENLTMKDYLGSYYPHGFRAEHFQTFFFNVVNRDDGRTWSTPWVIDDPMFYMTRR